MPESIPASLVIDTLKDTFREARAARAKEGWGPSPHEHLGWILSVPDTHQKTVLAALDKEQAIRVLTCATEDEACTIAAGGKTLNGFCHQLPNGGPLVCLPPPPSPPQETIDACSGHAAGAACSVTFNGHTISGACATLPDGTTHACAPVCHGS